MNHSPTAGVWFPRIFVRFPIFPISGHLSLRPNPGVASNPTTGGVHHHGNHGEDHQSLGCHDFDDFDDPPAGWPAPTSRLLQGGWPSARWPRNSANQQRINQQWVIFSECTSAIPVKICFFFCQHGMVNGSNIEHKGLCSIFFCVKMEPETRKPGVHGGFIIFLICLKLLFVLNWGRCQKTSNTKVLLLWISNLIFDPRENIVSFKTPKTVQSPHRPVEIINILRRSSNLRKSSNIPCSHAGSFVGSSAEKSTVNEVLAWFWLSASWCWGSLY